MEALTLLIALVALVIAVIAFQRTGGIKELRQEVDALGSRSDTVRERTANMLDKFEKVVRGKNKFEPEPPSTESGKESDTHPSQKPE